MARIYIDADSLPERHRSIVLRRVIGKAHAAWFVADRPLRDVERAIEEDKRLRRAPYRDTLTREEARKIGSKIHMVVVESGADSADDEIVRIAEAPALAITHDIPLAARLLEKGLAVIDDRGGRYEEGSIRERLSERSNNRAFREMGLFDQPSRRFDERAIQRFASAFDQAITELDKNNIP